ncbi:MAG: S-layer homology domain-containing protein [Cellulosilyticaceae bacterium]
MKKKFTRIALILGLTGVLCVNTFATSFTDVAQSHWAYAGVAYMQENGYMTKNSEGKFLPNDQVTYFEFSEILAKVTGYQDEMIIKDMDEQFKQDIRTNYQRQLPTIQQYEAKYKGWRKSSNEEIAYILGRGYLTADELAKFMVKTADGKEMNTIMTKQDLAVYLVRMIGKANTAVAEYNGTGFSDESSIKPENRPYVAYLKKAGLVNGDTNGKFNPNDKVTRAMCATMTTNAIRHKESLEETTPTPEPNGKVVIGKVYNVIPKNNAANETLVLVEVQGNNKFYTATPATVVKDAKGTVLNVKDVKIGQTLEMTLSGQSDTIQNITIQGEVKPEVEPDKAAVYTGEVDRIGRNGDLSIYTNGGSVSFVVDKNCAITYKGESIALDQVAVGDRVTIKVQNDQIMDISILEKNTNPTPSKDMEYVKVSIKPSHYVMTVQNGKTTEEIEVSKDVEVYRNGKEAYIDEIRVGDKLTFKESKGKVVEIQATYTESKIQGRVRKIVISSTPEVVVETKDGEVTVAITSNTDLYDNNTREDISLRDILLGMEVEVRLESKEAQLLEVKKAPSKVTYKGVIEYIGQGTRYIDVLVEYDAMTGETMTVKRINVPSDVTIMMDRKEVHRNKLEEEMEVLVTFNYGEELSPTMIEVLN